MTYHPIWHEVAADLRQDGLTYVEIAALLGVSVGSLSNWFGRSRDLVDVEPLARAYRASGLSQNEVAARLGWLRRRSDCRPGEEGDGTRLLRSLGLRRYKLGAGRGHGLRRRVSYETAVLIAEAIGVDPVDVGL